MTAVSWSPRFALCPARGRLRPGWGQVGPDPIGPDWIRPMQGLGGRGPAWLDGSLLDTVGSAGQYRIHVRVPGSPAPSHRQGASLRPAARRRGSRARWPIAVQDRCSGCSCAVGSAGCATAAKRSASGGPYPAVHRVARRPPGGRRPLPRHTRRHGTRRCPRRRDSGPSPSTGGPPHPRAPVHTPRPGTQPVVDRVLTGLSGEPGQRLRRE